MLPGVRPLLLATGCHLPLSGCVDGGKDLGQDHLQSTIVFACMVIGVEQTADMPIQLLFSPQSLAKGHICCAACVDFWYSCLLQCCDKVMATDLYCCIVQVIEGTNTTLIRV